MAVTSTKLMPPSPPVSDCFDDLIRADPPWLGCWRDRLALKSAAVAARMLDRNEEENALRDAVLLTPANGDPGPAGKLFWPHEGGVALTACLHQRDIGL
ncbi:MULTISPECIES: DUF1403 family protein [Agrobacterium]|uniref:DUF1403 family protein n=1 Tax=Agrobacterium TaxID=357 RepID=UPI00312C74B4